MKLSSIQVSLIAVFAALQALFALLPYAIPVGVSGQITLGIVGGSLIGILLGPVTGGSAVLIGSFIGVFLNPSGAIFSILTVLPPTVAAIAAGCVKLRRGYVAGGIMLASLLVFYAHPYGGELLVYPWLSIIAMIIAFSPLAFMAGSSFKSSGRIRLVFAIIIAAFVGALADKIVGDAIAIWYFSPGLTPPIWYSIMYVYPFERIFATFLITIITVPVYYGLKKANVIDSLK